MFIVVGNEILTDFNFDDVCNFRDVLDGVNDAFDIDSNDVFDIDSDNGFDIDPEVGFCSSSSSISTSELTKGLSGANTSSVFGLHLFGFGLNFDDFIVISIFF